MHEKILFFTFVSIFIATAILTIASLPGWIKIPSNYQKALFSALILEVIACVVILFKQTMMFDIKLKPNVEWVALGVNDGKLLHPELIVNDSVIHLGAPLQQAQERILQNEYELVNDPRGLLIQSVGDQFFLGKISNRKGRNGMIFNSLVSSGNEITGSSSYRKVKFSADRGLNSWQIKGAIFEDCPFEISVKDSPQSSTVYLIRNKLTDVIEFNSEDESENVINTDFRKLHFLENNNLFYLIRILEADLSSESRYINFMIVKLQPQLSL